MRRLITIPAFALFVAIAVPLWAQHGGGHAGGGGHSGGGGFSGGGGHAGFSGGAAHSGGGFSGGHASSSEPSVHAYSGPLSGAAAPRAFTRPPSSSLHSYSQRSFTPPNSSQRSLGQQSLGQRSLGQRSLGQRNLSQRAFSRPPSAQYRFRRPGRGVYGFNTYVLRNNCLGYPCLGGYGYYSPWLWSYGGYYDPYWWWDSGSDSGYDDGGYYQTVPNGDMNDQDAEDQYQQDPNQDARQQQMLSQEQADGDQDAYARSAGDAPEGAPVLPPTVLVFRDQHKEEVRNYAIVGQTLWNFAPHHTQKIPLSDLDLPATTKANSDRGLTFRLPLSGEAQ
jgi:hypothetical protein